jgi:uncharacterized protein YraI
VTVTASRLRVHSAPSAASPVVGHLDEGTQVTVSAIGDGWVQVALNGQGQGWVSADYLAAS